MVGISNPNQTMRNNKAMNESLEANTMDILDSSGLKDSRDVYDDKLAFLEAVRNVSLMSDSPTAPSWKMFDAVFEILRGSHSLELVITSYQLLTDLDKHYPRIYLKRSDNQESCGPIELVVVKEAWVPFSVSSETSHSEGEGTSRNSLYGDSLATNFCTLIEEIGQYADKRVSQLIKPAENMILIQYLVSVLETDFLPRHTLYKETLDWALFRESLLSVLLGSRRLNFKSFARDCLSVIYKRCDQHIDTSLRNLKDISSVSGSAKAAQDCDIALAYAATQLERQTFTAIERLFTMIMELDVIKKRADLNGLTSRSDGLRTPIMDIILDDLTYVKDHLSPFLKVFSEPKWKLETILQYFLKYCPKSAVRTWRNETPEDVTFKDMLSYFSTFANTKAITRKITPENAQLLLAHAFQAHLSLHYNSEHMDSDKPGSKSEICSGLISAFQNIRKIDENLEVSPFEKGALFTAATIVWQKL